MHVLVVQSSMYICHADVTCMSCRCHMYVMQMSMYVMQMSHVYHADVNVCHADVTYVMQVSYVLYVMLVSHVCHAGVMLVSCVAPLPLDTGNWLCSLVSVWT